MLTKLWYNHPGVDAIRSWTMSSGSCWSSGTYQNNTSMNHKVYCLPVRLSWHSVLKAVPSNYINIIFIPCCIHTHRHTCTRATAGRSEMLSFLPTSSHQDQAMLKTSSVRRKMRLVKSLQRLFLCLWYLARERFPTVRAQHFHTIDLAVSDSASIHLNVYFKQTKKSNKQTYAQPNESCGTNSWYFMINI